MSLKSWCATAVGYCMQRSARQHAKEAKKEREERTALSMYHRCWYADSRIAAFKLRCTSPSSAYTSRSLSHALAENFASSARWNASLASSLWCSRCASSPRISHSVPVLRYGKCCALK